MLDTVKINHVQHISFTQSRLTDAVSVILSELLSYEHPSKGAGHFYSAVVKGDNLIESAVAISLIVCIVGIIKCQGSALPSGAQTLEKDI